MRPLQSLFIVVGLILVIAMYVLYDIRPEGSGEELKEAISFNEAESFHAEAWNYIDSTNKTFSLAEQQKISQWVDMITNPLSEKPQGLADSIILFYNKKEKSALAAWFYTEKAQMMHQPQEWFSAGNVQFSESQNSGESLGYRSLLYTRAVKSLENALSQTPENQDYKIALAESYLVSQDQIMSGITLLQEVTDTDSLHAEANLLLGRYGIISGQFEKAIIRLENVLSLQPTNAEALFLLGEAYVGKGDFPAAIEQFEKCVSEIDNEELKTEIALYIEDLKLNIP